MAEITLTRGKAATIDESDFDRLMQWRWFAVLKGNNYWRAVRKGKKDETSLVFMHREIIKAHKGDIVDHINGNALDNRRDNLRIVTAHENCFNRGKMTGSRLKYKGVTYVPETGKYRVNIYPDGEKIELGQFLDEKEAAFTYNVAALRLYGKYARINKIDF